LIRTRPARAPLAAAVSLAALAALAGCTSAPERSAPSPSGSGPASPAPSAVPGAGQSPPAPGSTGLIPLPVVDEAKVPRDPAAARALLAKVIATAQMIGPDVVPSTPYESAPGTMPYLDRDCVWQTGAPPADVLATGSRYFHIPAAGGKGAVQISATVTVHRTRAESAWEIARSMEEVMRCPDQQLRADQQVKDLFGTTLQGGEYTNRTTEDTFTEYGNFHGTREGGPHPYTWTQAQYGPVTVAIALKGSSGIVRDDLQQPGAYGLTWMMQRARNEIGRAG
jgi:hypothetical protein